MESPVTDIVVVCDPDKAPAGYTVITKCPCGHDAQLWEKVIGGEDGKRYLCYSKQAQDDGKVIEDMYIPGASQQYLRKEYKIITDTVEGQEPFYHKQLAVKRALPSHATTVVVDLIVARSRDNISKLYHKLAKVNGLRIAFRTGKPSSAQSSKKEDVTSDLKRLSITGSDAKVHAKLNEYSPSPATPPSHTTSHLLTTATDPTLYSPSPPLGKKQQDDNVVRMKYASPVQSSLPPPRHSQPPANHQSPSPPLPSGPAPPPSGNTQFPVTFASESSTYPPPPPQSATPTMYPPPPPIAATGSTVTTNVGGVMSYPHPGGSSSNPPPPGQQSLPYQMAPTTAAAATGTQYPQGGFYGGYNHAGYNQQAGGGAFYSAMPPNNPGGYDTNIGFSFGGGAGATTGQPAATTLPAPYNPYHHQQQQQQQQQQPQQQQPSYYPQPGQQNTYGFNI